MSHTLLVIDTRDIDRRNNIVELCADALTDIIIYAYSDGAYMKWIEDGYYDNSSKPPQFWDIIIWHYRQENILIDSRVGIEVWYGGEGAELEKGKEWNIYRKLLTSEDVTRDLNSKLMKELINWAVINPLDRSNVPTLLRPNTNYLSALSILCQGYLLVYCARHSRDRQETCIQILKEVGFEKPEFAALHKERDLYSFSCELAEWWQEPFCKEINFESDDSSSYLLKELGKENSHLNASNGRIGLPNEIRSLVKNFCNGQNVNEVQDVLDAYLKTIEVLTKSAE